MITLHSWDNSLGSGIYIFLYVAKFIKVLIPNITVVLYKKDLLFLLKVKMLIHNITDFVFHWKSLRYIHCITIIINVHVTLISQTYTHILTSSSG